MKHIHLVMILIIIMFFSVGCTINFDTSKLKETRNLTLLADDINLLEIDVSSGGLIIKGEEGRTEIEAVANLEYTSNISNEDIQFSLEKTGSSAKLLGSFKSQLIMGYTSQSMDIIIKVPKLINMSIKDGSGKIQISKIEGDLELDDGSGDITITNLLGTLEVIDGSGDIELTNIADVKTIEDGSGIVLIQDSGGNLTMNDNSGDIRILHHNGSIDLTDGSGQIEIVELDGTVTIDDSSGDIKVTDVTKDVIIVNDGSGDVEINDVKGSISK